MQDLVREFFRRSAMTAGVQHNQMNVAVRAGKRVHTVAAGTSVARVNGL
jgi:hypothetical protein